MQLRMKQQRNNAAQRHVITVLPVQRICNWHATGSVNARNFALFRTIGEQYAI